MKRNWLIGILVFAVFALQAQEISIPANTQKVFDSLSQLSSKKWLMDSLSVVAWGDSLSNGVTRQATYNLSKINKSIDSLNRLQLPTNRLLHQADSINQKKDQLLASVNNKQQELLSGTKKKLNDWQTKLKGKLGLTSGSVNSVANDLNVKPTGNLNLPTDQLSIKELNLPMDELKIPGLESVDFQKLELPTDLKDLNQSLPFTQIDGLQEWQSKITGVTGQLPTLEGIKANPDKLIETAATNIDGVKELRGKMNAGGLEQTEYGKIIKDAKNPDALKQVAVDQVKKEAINHFAGKEQVLQSAMEQISKYKKSYPSINSLSDIKKRPPNPMKGKPFMERLVPGFALQIHTKNYLNFDINPFAAYKLSGRFSLGLGWNQRFAMDWSTKTFMHDGRVYGPRAFTDFKLPRGFSIRLEAEYLNTYVPPNISTGDTRRVWVFSTMTGLKKDYRFFKKIKGFTIVQFDLVRLFKTSNNSPYADVVNTRFGFEFLMKKKAPTKKSGS